MKRLKDFEELLKARSIIYAISIRLMNLKPQSTAISVALKSTEEPIQYPIKENQRFQKYYAQFNK